MKPIFYSKFLNVILVSGSFILPQLTNAQQGNPTRIERAQMHHEVLDDKYIPNVFANTEKSPAYRFESSLFFTAQVNVNANGENILWDAANEPSIAIDPTNPNRMAIGWRQFDNVTSNFRQAGYGYTLDGGETWTFPGVINPGIFRSDPVLDADAEGNLYYNSLTSDANNNMTCKVYKINDGSWDEGTEAKGGDKQWMRIDKTTGSGSGNNYSFWTSYWSSCYPGAFTRSTDFGNSYEDCSIVSGDPSWGTLAIGLNSELFIVGAGNADPIIVTKSITAQDPDQTVTWSSTTAVDLDGYLDSQVDVNPAGLLGQAWIDVDVSDGPGRGNVYVVASVRRASINDPGDVMFNKSVDGGLTWGNPRRLNNDFGNSNYQWFGTMSVAPGGRIDVVWLDTRDANGNPPYSSALYYSYSVDQGETWTENEKLSENFDPHIGWPQQQKMGDYFDMKSDDNSAHLAWANTLNGEEDVYYARITPQVVGIDKSPENQFRLSFNCYPNPFKGNTSIRYKLPKDNFVTLGIYDMYGQEVRNLVKKEEQAGLHNFTFNADELTEGIYYCRLTAGSNTQTIRMILIK